MGGGDLNIQAVKKGAEIILQFIITAPNDAEEAGFSLLHEIIFHPHLKNGEFAVSKNDYLKDLIDDKIADPKKYALDRCIEEMFGDFGFGIDGDGRKEDIDKINGLYEHYKYVLSNSQTELFLISNTEEDNAIMLADKFFGEIQNRKIEKETSKACDYNYLYEKKDMSQTRLCIGIDMGEGSRFEKMIYNEFLGGSDSLLFNNVREKNELCYYIGSTYFSLANAVFIQAGVNSDAADKAIELIKKNICEKPSSDDIKKARSTIIDRLGTINDHPLALIDFYVTQSFFNDNITPETMIDMISGIEKTDLEPCIKMVYILGGNDNECKNT